MYMCIVNENNNNNNCLLLIQLDNRTLVTQNDTYRLCCEPLMVRFHYLDKIRYYTVHCSTCSSRLDRFYTY